MGEFMRRIKVGALIVAVGALAITATACAKSDQVAPSSASQPSSALAGDRVVMGEGRDRTASRTVADWVTYADHVLVVTVESETLLMPSKKELERGEGMINRTVKLRVDQVLWSAPDAAQPAPKSLEIPVAGVVFNNNSEKGSFEAKFALEGSSRLEPGHTYIKAFEWMDDPCSDKA